MSVSRLLTVASESASTTAALSFMTIALGVPLGTHRPCQNEMLIPGKPSSSLVGISGAANQRVLANTVGLDLVTEHVGQRTCRLVEHQVDMAGDLVLDRRTATSIGHELEAGVGRALKIDATHLGRTAGSDGCSRCLVRICLEPGDQLLE